MRPTLKARLLAAACLTGVLAAPLPGTASAATASAGPARAAASRAVLDLDGDGRSDFAVQVRDQVTWAPAAAQTVRRTVALRGLPVPARWTRTDRTQLASVDLLTWTWTWTVPAAGGGTTTFRLGRDGDIPLVGNFLPQTPTDEAAVFHPSTGGWDIRGTEGPIGYGRLGDIPVPADYDGDGTTDIAVFRPTTGQWFVRGLVNGVGYGRFGDHPVPADYDGDGRDDIAVARNGVTKTWFVRGAAAVTYARGEDVEVPGDYDGDGDGDLAVHRSTSRGVAENHFFVAGRWTAPAMTGTPLASWYPTNYVYTVLYGD